MMLYSPTIFRFIFIRYIKYLFYVIVYFSVLLTILNFLLLVIKSDTVLTENVIGLIYEIPYNIYFGWNFIVMFATGTFIYIHRKDLDILTWQIMGMSKLAIALPMILILLICNIIYIFPYTKLVKISNEYRKNLTMKNSDRIETKSWFVYEKDNYKNYIYVNYYSNISDKFFFYGVQIIKRNVNENKQVDYLYSDKAQVKKNELILEKVKIISSDNKIKNLDNYVESDIDTEKLTLFFQSNQILNTRVHEIGKLIQLNNIFKQSNLDNRYIVISIYRILSSIILTLAIFFLVLFMLLDTNDRKINFMLKQFLLFIIVLISVSIDNGMFIISGFGYLPPETSIWGFRLLLLLLYFHLFMQSE